ncbi:MAG: hypothetical protein GY953_38085, partial [bacterium]|nr:hypothetical protein [bacterium]
MPAATVAWAAGGEVSGEGTMLRPDTPVERRLSGGEAHRYRFAPSTSKPWRVAVQQLDIDVVLEVTPPGGESS